MSPVADLAERRLALIRRGDLDGLAELDAQLAALVPTATRAELEALQASVQLAGAVLREQLAHTGAQLRAEPERRRALRGYAATLAR